MKFVIVIACLLAVAYANDERGAVTTDEKVEVNPDGFNYEWKTSNGIEAQQVGKQEDHEHLVVSGSYSYISPEGKEVHVTYTADKDGYHPVVKS